MKKIILSREQVIMYFLEFQRTNIFQTLHQDVSSQHFCRGSFQLPFAMESKGKLLNVFLTDYFKKL